MKPYLLLPRCLWLGMSALAAAACCNADVIVFDDVDNVLSVTLNGVPVTGNGGRVTDFYLSGGFVSFDLSLGFFTDYTTLSAFTNLIDPSSGDVSDRFVYEFVNLSSVYSVQFGLNPTLPVIPPGAEDLTTIPVQGLPPDPYYLQPGAPQLVGTAFLLYMSPDTFYAQTEVPEPRLSAVLLLTILLGICLRARTQSAFGRCMSRACRDDRR